MEKRLKYAENLIFKDNDLKIIFSGGNGEARWLKEHSGLNGATENQSLTTYDNLLNAIKIFKNPKKVYIITDSTHKFRTAYLAGRILREIPHTILAVRMPLSYHLKRLWYEGSRFIHNVLL